MYGSGSILFERSDFPVDRIFAFKSKNEEIEFLSIGDIFAKNMLLNFAELKNIKVGREPWSSSYGKRLMFQRSWVRIPAPYTEWTFFHICLL